MGYRVKVIEDIVDVCRVGEVGRVLLDLLVLICYYVFCGNILGF